MPTIGDNIFDDLTGEPEGSPKRSGVSRAQHAPSSDNGATTEDLNRNLSNLNKNIEALIKDMSQSAAADAREFGGKGRFGNGSKGDSKSFADGFADELRESMGMNDIKDALRQGMKGLADEMGVEMKDLQGELGKSLAQDLEKAFRETNIGNTFLDKIREGSQHWAEKTKDILENGAPLDLRGEMESGMKDIFGTAMQGLEDSASNIIGKDRVDKLKDLGSKAGNRMQDMAGNLADSKAGQAAGGAKNYIADLTKSMGNTPFGKALGNMFGRGSAAMSTIFGGAAATAGKGMISSAMGAAGGPWGIAAMALLENVSDVLMKIGEKFGKLMGSLSKAADREASMRQKKIEEGNKRIEADLKSIVQQPFKILEEAANKVYSTWDSVMSYVNQTQGYTKAELQSLMGSYSSRLQGEGLGSIISGSEVTENLKKVLESGITGPVAEEFAYIATKLSAAVPSEDFFSYASTYASIIANAQKDGMDQSAAVAYANSQLEQFASNVLYAGRELSGGFMSGLKGAQTLFDQSVQIANAARSGNASVISGVLTSVSSIVGAIAPDLASGIVTSVYDAALGGNTPSVVALRSLAGGNASNTEFLRSFANDPQGTFAALFGNLASMQNMSPDNYMEVAEGLSSVFGISKEAFQRVDFAYLADAVSAMNVNNKSLAENLEQLESGQSTLSKEQTRIAQINEYLVDEGLSYVLDNEVARQVQQHMWDEQLAIQMQEATYGVELRGSALEFLNELQNAVRNILGFLNPFGMMGKTIALAQTVTEALSAPDDVKRVLEAGKVGKGNSDVLSKLTSYGTDLNLTRKYLEVISDTVQGKGSANYVWGMVGKSMAKGLGTTPSGARLSTPYTQAAMQSQDVNLAKLQANFDRMRATMSDFFSGTMQSQIDAAVESERKRIASNAVFSQADINALVNEYMSQSQGYGMSKAMAEARARLTLQQRAEDAADAEARRIVDERVAAGTLGSTGYEAWAATASQFGISDLEAAMSELGYDVADVKNYFSNMDLQEASRAQQERDAKEEAFWANVQDLLDTVNVNVHDVFDKSDMMGVFWPGVDSHFNQVHAELNTIDAHFLKFHNDWIEYYIKHSTYNEHMGLQLATKINSENRNQSAKGIDRLNEMVKALRENGVEDLMDPTVQQNTLLAEILFVLQGIFQQNNTQGKLKLPDALQALATGYTEQERDNA